MEPKGSLAQEYPVQFDNLARTPVVAEVADDFARNLRLLIDARKIFDGGIGTYLRNLLLGLTECGVRPAIIISKIAWQKLMAKQPNLASKVQPIFNSYGGYSLSGYLKLAAQTKANQYQLFHSPHYTLPFGLKIPAVITVHDLIHITHPQKFYYPFIGKLLIGSAVKRASAVVTVSSASSKVLGGTFGSKLGQKLMVIENSIAPEWLDASAQKHSSITTEPYFLSVISTNKPHKGIRDLINAYAAYRMAAQGSAWSLLLVGQAFQQSAGYHNLVDQLGLADSVKILGAVEESKLREIYAAAQAVVIPSLAEGFGLSALEAHAYGKAVIIRPVAALKEIALAADCIATDFSVAALTAALLELQSKKLQAGQVRNDFQKQATQRFDVLQNARKMLTVYRRALNQGD